MNVSLNVNDLTTSYKKFSVTNATFSLNSGDILGLVGRSGSGKSTLIKTMLGQKRSDKGKVEVMIDNNPTRLTEVIGYSPQENSLYPYLTVEENMFTFGRLMKLKKETIQSKLDSLLKRLDLQNCRHKRIVQLSGGMQKRADLAVTLIHDPKIIILDEPFTGLDISLQKFIWKLLKEMSKEGRIIIISSHMLNDVQKNCNKLGLIEKGHYYNTHQIRNRLEQSKDSLESYLAKLFAQDLETEAK